jgi:hypothetical protein
MGTIATRVGSRSESRDPRRGQTGVSQNVLGIVDPPVGALPREQEHDAEREPEHGPDADRQRVPLGGALRPVGQPHRLNAPRADRGRRRMVARHRHHCRPRACRRRGRRLVAEAKLQDRRVGGVRHAEVVAYVVGRAADAARDLLDHCLVLWDHRRVRQGELRRLRREAGTIRARLRGDEYHRLCGHLVGAHPVHTEGDRRDRDHHKRYQPPAACDSSHAEPFWRWGHRLRSHRGHELILASSNRVVGASAPTRTDASVRGDKKCASGGC